MKIKTILLALMFGMFTFTGVGMVISTSTSAVELNQAVCGDDVDPDKRPDICADLDPVDKDVNPLYGPEGVLTRAVNALSLVIGVVAIIIIILAGIKMTMSTGDAGKVKSARDQIIYACVGLVVAVLAQAIVRFVLNRIGV